MSGLWGGFSRQGGVIGLREGLFGRVGGIREREKCSFYRTVDSILPSPHFLSKNTA